MDNLMQEAREMMSLQPGQTPQHRSCLNTINEDQKDSSGRASYQNPSHREASAWEPSHIIEPKKIFKDLFCYFEKKELGCRWTHPFGNPEAFKSRRPIGSLLPHYKK